MPCNKFNRPSDSILLKLFMRNQFKHGAITVIKYLKSSFNLYNERHEEITFPNNRDPSLEAKLYLINNKTIMNKRDFILKST